MMVHKAYKFRIYPNKEQATLINKTIGCTRFVFNFFHGKQKDNDAYWAITEEMKQNGQLPTNDWKGNFFNELLEGSFFTKQRLNEAMAAIHASSFDDVKISTACSIYSQKEMIFFSFSDGTLHSFYQNQTERMMLRRKIYEAGCFEQIEDAVCIELERTGKYVFNSFLNYAEKKPAIREDMLRLARYVYTYALEKFGNYVHKHPELLTKPKQASAYLSTIMYNESLEQMAKYAHQAATIQQLINQEHLHRSICQNELGHDVDYVQIHEHIQPIHEKFRQAEAIHTALSQWCETWIISRVKSATASQENEPKTDNKRFKNKEAVTHYLTALKTQTYDQLDKLIERTNRFSRQTSETLKKKKQTFTAYFAIQQDRLPTFA